MKRHRYPFLVRAANKSKVTVVFPDPGPPEIIKEVAGINPPSEERIVSSSLPEAIGMNKLGSK